ncbi:SDR family NAD(P)-dependent oxidoreductase [Blastococcus xanthinilyticus]|uniref:3-oxoacyl-[acyl-carrier protein] reductase n=1 Tax=Blastococcus xanthinilyticus TaxID=1564164 RepID=A0A5S5CZ79_9ACTN|nr:SDR family oxidoreductase [Blastococcus xanthinilyticus]TYP89053.1 3-oxoacyl-[acyl-carrier protein] reductase [Blastococcus xanthinilyticus]
MGELDGRAALVTGGGRGIGAAIALALAESGADVAVTYQRSASTAEDVCRRVRQLGHRGLALRAEAADASAVRDSVQQTVEELGRLDVLVHNAGVFPSGPLEQVTLADLDAALDVHARSAFLAAQAAAPHMQHGGRLIFVGSCFAERVPYGGITAYAMSKAALSGLVRGLARDLGPRGITATVVHPGSTDTDMNPADGPDADAERDLIALGRYASPAEIAATVAALAGQAGAYVSGTAILVDGGFAA